MSGNVFISYRRSDSEGYAGRLYDRLSAHLGPGNVFMDVDTIEPGVDFAREIEAAVNSCDVLLAIIGPQWLTVKDRQGKLRLQDSQDYVRLEIAAALERGIRVIPTLIQGASMPHSSALPENLKPLARRNAIELSSTRFHTDVDKLIRAIERAIETAHKDQYTDQRKSGEGEKLGELNVAQAGDSLIESLAENLSIETLGGVATPVINRGAPLPVRISKIFSTAADNQTSVEIHLLRGVRSMAADNTSLGKFQLDGILPAPRGIPQIEVTFDVDANGILKVSAQDKATGHSKQLSIKAASKLSKAESERIEKEAGIYKKEDQKQNDLIKAREKAENEIDTSRNFLKDMGDKLAGSEKAQLFQKIDEASAVLENKNADASLLAKAAANLAEIRENLQKSVNQKEQNHPSMDIDEIFSLYFGKRNGERKK
jgi:hypothetical protein